MHRPSASDTIELIERKAFNRHDLVENLGLALSMPPKIKLPDPAPSGGP